MIWLSQVDYWLEREESPESFIKYQLLKIKIKLHIKDIRNNNAIRNIQ